MRLGAFLLAGIAAMALTASGQETAADKPDGEADTATPRQLEARASRMVVNAEEMIKGGDEARGVGMLEAVPKMFPETQARFKAFLALGRQRIAKRQLDEALAVLRMAESADDEEVKAEALMLQANAYREQKRPGEAVTLLRRITQDFPASPFANDAYFWIGQIHFDGGRWAKAVEAFSMVGTAVPEARGEGTNAVVLAEAGQMLFAHVTDRDLPILAQLGEKLGVRATAKSGDTEIMLLETFGRDGGDALASIQTVSEPSQPNDGKLTVQGGDEVEVKYIDKTTASGAIDVPLATRVRVVSSGVLAFMDGAYRQSVKGVFVGQPAFLRLRDLDLDTTPQKDLAQVKIVATYVKPAPTSEEIALGAEPLPEGEEILVERASIVLPLQETQERSGVFEGRFIPMLLDTNSPAPAGALAVMAEDVLTVSYEDARHLAGMSPVSREAKAVVLVGGSTDPQSIVASSSDPDVQSRKLLLEAQLLQKWGSIFKEVGLEVHAKSKSEEGLRHVMEIMDLAGRHSLDRAVVENAYVVKWDLQLLQNNLGAAIATCRELVRRYPDTVYADLALMKIATAKADSNEQRDIHEAMRVFSSVISLPNSGNKAEAQYRIAQAQEKLTKLRASGGGRAPDFSAAIQAYRTCAETYPDSAFAGDSFKRIIDYYISLRDYARAGETLERVFQDYADAPWLDEMLLQWGIVLYRQNDKAGATAKFQQVLEEYPGGEAAKTAAALLGRVAP